MIGLRWWSRLARRTHRGAPFRVAGGRCRAPRRWPATGRSCRAHAGGTLPISELFQRHMAVETVFFSFSTADEDYHAPNEFFRVHRLHEGLEAWARYWEILGQARRMKPVAPAPSPSCNQESDLPKPKRVWRHIARRSRKTVGVRDHRPHADPPDRRSRGLAWPGNSVRSTPSSGCSPSRSSTCRQPPS